MVNGQAVNIVEHDYPEDLQRKSLEFLQRSSVPGHKWPLALREAVAAVEKVGRVLQSWIRRRQILAKELPLLGPDLDYCRKKAAAKEAAEEAEFKALEDETERMAAKYAANRGRVVEEAGGGSDLEDEAADTEPGPEVAPGAGGGKGSGVGAAGLAAGGGEGPPAGGGRGPPMAGGRGAPMGVGRGPPVGVGRGPPVYGGKGGGAGPQAPPGAPPPLQTAGPGMAAPPGVAPGAAAAPLGKGAPGVGRQGGFIELGSGQPPLRGPPGRVSSALLVGPAHDTALVAVSKAAQAVAAQHHDNLGVVGGKGGGGKAGKGAGGKGMEELGGGAPGALPAELGAPAPPGPQGPPGEPGAPASPLEIAAPGGNGGLGQEPLAPQGGSVSRVLQPDCDEFRIPPSLVASRRAASEAYWAFEKALNVAEEKVDKAMDELVVKGA